MLFFKKFRGDFDSVDYEDLDNQDYSYDLLMMMNIEKSRVLEHYLKNQIEIITNQ